MSRASNTHVNQSSPKLSKEQEVAINSFATKVGEQFGNLLTVLLTEGLTLMMTKNEPPQPELKTTGGLLKAVEVAKALNISRTKAYQLMQQGVIPTLRIGRSPRVRPEDLHDFINR